MHPCVDCTALGNRWNSSRKLTRFSAKTLGIMPTIIQLKNPRPLAPPTTFGQENPEVGVARGTRVGVADNNVGSCMENLENFLSDF